MSKTTQTSTALSLIPLFLTRLNHSGFEKLIKNYLADYDSKNLDSESDSIPHT